MTYRTLFKSPYQVYREAVSEVTAYKVGVILRIIWDVTMQILKWSAVIAAATAVGAIYFLWQLVFGTMKR